MDPSKWVAGVALSVFSESTWHANPDRVEHFISSEDPTALFITPSHHGVADGAIEVHDALPSNTAHPVLILYKPSGALDLEEPMNAQIGALVVPGGPAVIGLLATALIPLVLRPVVETWGGSDGTPVASHVAQKTMELAQALAVLQHHQEVPFLDLTIEPQDALKTGDLDALQRCAAHWKKQIRQLVHMTRDVAQGSASEEAAFWLTMDGALHHIERQLESGPAHDALEVLQQGKRFHATVNFVRDTGLPDAVARVQGYGAMLRDLPLGELAASTSLIELGPRVHAVLSILTRRLRASGYPVVRAVQLVEAVGRDVARLLRQFLSHADVLSLDTDVESLSRNVEDLAAEWDAGLRDFAATARDVMRRRAERYVPLRVQSAHSSVVSRLERVVALRMRHANLVSTLPDPAPVREAWNASWAGVNAIAADEDVWRACERRYATAVDSAEAALAQKLRAELEAAHGDLPGMYSVFARAGALVARPAVQAAVREYGTELVHRIRRDVERLRVDASRLHDPLHNNGGRPAHLSSAGALALPPAAAHIVRLRQLRARLDQLTSRMAMVLGPDWAAHADGLVVADDAARLADQLAESKAIRQWAAAAVVEDAWDASAPVLRVSGPLQVSVGGVDTAGLAVVEDCRALQALGVRLPPALVSGAGQGYEVALQARNLGESLEVVLGTRNRLAAFPRARAVTRRVEAVVYALMERGLAGNVRWAAAAEFVAAFERAAFVLDREVARALAVDTAVEEHLRNIDDTFDAANLAVRAAEALNNPHYIRLVRSAVEQRSKRRLKSELAAWKPLRRSHRVIAGVRGLSVDPEFADVRTSLLESLSALVRSSGLSEASISGGVSGIIVGNIAGDDEDGRHHKKGYGTISEDRNMSVDSSDGLDGREGTVAEAVANAVRRCLAAVEASESAAKPWLAFQRLWDAEPDMIAPQDRLAFLEAMAVPAMDSRDVDVSAAVTPVRKRVEVWRAALLPPVASEAAEISTKAVQSLREARAGVESTPVDADSLEAYEVAERTLAEYEPSVKLVERAAAVGSGVDAQTAITELHALRQGLERRRSESRTGHAGLVSRLREHQKTWKASCEVLAARWAASKPIQGTLDAEHALARCGSIRVDLDDLAAAGNGLASTARFLGVEFDLNGPLASETYELDDLRADLEAVEGVWTALRVSHTQLAALDAVSWTDVDPQKARAGLAALELEVRELPPKLAPYAAVPALREAVKVRSVGLEAVQLLRAPAIEPRHLSGLFGQVPVTLGDVWASTIDLAAVKAVAAIAETERRLRTYISELAAQWAQQTLVADTSGVLRGLPQALSLAEDHAAALGAMHASPHFNAVETDVVEWETRLEGHSRSLGALADAQRQFVRLRGVFSASLKSSASISPDSNAPKAVSTQEPDEKTLQMKLPEENRFRALDKETRGLFSALAGRPALDAARALETTLGPSLRRVQGQLQGLQRALTTWLMAQRAAVPRLWFVGDEAVLEIVGSGTLDAYLPQLFGGVAALECSSEGITGVRSAEGELLAFTEPVAHGPVLEILPRIETAMKSAFETATRKAIASWPAPGDFVSWFETYPVEAVALALRIKRGFASGLDELAHYHPETPLQRRRVEIVVVELLQRQRLDYVVESASINSIKSSEQSPETNQGNSDHSNTHEQSPQDGSISSEQGSISSLRVRFHATEIEYAWEWPGTPEPLVHTPLTARFWAAAMLALGRGLGAAPFGPAGTGKTESVKALGAALGRRVAVFNCDDTFDFTAVAQILQGAAATGSWVCFDELNRLEPGVLSAAATEIAHTPAQVFVTLNPAYRGRQRLPTNLRQQFRSFAMAAPDAVVIAEVLLRASGFKDARTLAYKAVGTLQTLETRLEPQKHYDWSLRALKGVLKVARSLITVGSKPGETIDDATRAEISEIKNKKDIDSRTEAVQDGAAALRAAFDRVVRPRLVGNDISVFDKLMESIAPASQMSPIPEIVEAARSLGLEPTAGLLTKTSELLALLPLQPGVLLVGEPATGKSAALNVASHVLGAQVTRVDASVVPKTELVGSLDDTTREWTDGLLCEVLRDAAANHRRHIFVVDGPVEPSWAEALNSLLDDNRVLSLASGERIPLPSCMSLVFETGEIGAATPATVSRCGLVLFDDTVPAHVLCPEASSELVAAAESSSHAMKWSVARSASFYTSLPHATPSERQVALAWAFGGDVPSKQRRIISSLTFDSGSQNNANDLQEPDHDHEDLTACYVSELTGDILRWTDAVPDASPDDVVVPTAATAAHEALVSAVVAASVQTPLVLVGPPGSGKTMTVEAALRKLDVGVMSLTLSEDASPDTLVRTLEAHCEFSGSGSVLAPPNGRRAVLFIDEINLPGPNTWGSRPVLELLRGLVEHGGFWRRGRWVRVERVRVIAAGNPPSMRSPLPSRLLRHCAVVEVGYPGLGDLRRIYGALLSRVVPQSHVGGLLDAMLAVYHQATSAVAHRSSEDVSEQEVSRSDDSFTHPECSNPIESGDEKYTYSPRELSRWVQGISEWQSETDLPNLWAHEGLRLFGDRRKDPVPVVEWLESAGSTLGLTQDPRNLRWTRLLSRTPRFAALAELRHTLAARMRTFRDEEGGPALVLHAPFVELVLRIDRVLARSGGHLMLAGPPGTGRASAVRFAAWLRGVTVIWLGTWRGYGESQFDADLRRAVLRSLDRPTVLVLDESAGLRSAFLERMNALLASGDAPGLFDADSNGSLDAGGGVGDDWREVVARFDAAGAPATDAKTWLRGKVLENLHAVFVVSQLGGPGASPALLNRCVQSWSGEWPSDARHELLVAQRTDAPPAALDVLASWSMPTIAFVETASAFFRIYTAHKTALEDQQRHLVGGGQQLTAAVMDGARLRRALGEKQTALEAKDAESRAVLSQMLADQAEAERRREAGAAIEAALASQRRDADARRAAVRAQLAQAQPAVDQAAAGVRDIRKAHLVELRALQNPPDPIKLALEAVCMVLGLIVPPQIPGTADWRRVQHAARSDEFVPRILALESVPAPAAKVLAERYVGLPAFSVAAAQRASRACGPLVAWVQAQLAYRKARDAVQPLQDEALALDTASREREAQLAAIRMMLDELAAKVEAYKREYARVIAECESLKASMAHVRGQLSRAEALLASLKSEQTRWGRQAAEFGHRRAALAGNSVIAAFLVGLGGAMDSPGRESLIQSVKLALDAAGVAYDVLDVFSFLSSLSETESTSDVDENAAILANLGSVPLVIDPEGSFLPSSGSNASTGFMLSLDTLGGSSSALVASCLDSQSLIKRLQTALRVGQRLVVEHAENLDPVLVPLLRGSIALLPQGSMKAAPGFQLILYSRLVAASVPRAVRVSFEVTPHALHRMVLDKLLHHRSPGLAERRKRVIDVQTRTAKRLLRLERELLAALQGPTSGRSVSGSEGLLDNEALLGTLETLKSEATALEETQADAQRTLGDTATTLDALSPAADAVVRVHAVLGKLSRLSVFYTFDLGFLLSALRVVSTQADVQAALAAEVWRRAAPGLRWTHRSELKSELSAACGPFTPPTPFTASELVTLSPRIVAGLVGDADVTLAAADSTSPDSAIPPSESDLKKPTETVTLAMGAREAAQRADRMLGQASATGQVLVIQNAELDAEWLARLVERLPGVLQRAHPGFRLLLTSAFPAESLVPLLGGGAWPLVAERPPGIRSGLRELASIPSTPLECRLAWLHCAICEYSWSKPYEFLSSDYAAAVDAARQDPALVYEAIYGGKIDAPEDLALLRRLVDHSLTSLVVPSPSGSSSDISSPGSHTDIEKVPGTKTLPGISDVPIPPNVISEWIQQQPDGPYSLDI